MRENVLIKLRNSELKQYQEPKKSSRAHVVEATKLDPIY